MRRFTLVVVTAATLLAADSRIGLAQNAVHHIDVALLENAQGFEVVAPCKTHKVDAATRGDTVEWHVHNRGRQPVEVAIGKIGRHPKDTCTRKEDHAKHEKEPVDFTFLEFTKAKAVVPAGGTDQLQAVIKMTTLAPRTYKYAILGSGGKVLLDPEIEIEK